MTILPLEYLINSLDDFDDPNNCKKCKIRRTCPQCKKEIIEEVYISIPPAILAMALCSECGEDYTENCAIVGNSKIWK